MSQIKEKDVFERIKNSKEIPSLPQVLTEVVRVALKEESAPKDLADVISKDQGLTARVLRLVNSPFYGHTGKITTIHFAVAQLGARPVMVMALSTGLYHMFDGPNCIIDRKLFWRHSLETAIACREIARTCKMRKTDESFVLGLMHDLGILVLESNFPKVFKKIWDRALRGENQVEVEEAFLGTNHAKVGKFLLDKWGLPEFMGEAIRSHHEEFADHKKENRLARIVKLGNMLSKFRPSPMVHLNGNQVGRIYSLADSLGIDRTHLRDLQVRTMDMLLAESKFLDIEIGSISELLGAANNLIYMQYSLVEKMLKENQRMTEQIARDKVKKAALQSLKTIASTLAHYINNSLSNVLMGVSLLQSAVNQGKVIDEEEMILKYKEMTVKSIEKTSKFLEVLSEMSSFDTTQYADETAILDVEDRLKKRLEKI